jgi:hypothetical protein
MWINQEATNNSNPGPAIYIYIYIYMILVSHFRLSIYFLLEWLTKNYAMTDSLVSHF